MNPSDNHDNDRKGRPPVFNSEGKVKKPYPELGAAHPDNISLPPDDEWDGNADILLIGLMSYGVMHHEACNWWTRNLLVSLRYEVPMIKKTFERRDLRGWKANGIQALAPNGMYTYNLLCYLKYETTHPMAICLIGNEANNYYGAIKDRENTLVMRLNMPTVHNKGAFERFHGSGVFTKTAKFVGKPLDIWML